MSTRSSEQGGGLSARALRQLRDSRPATRRARLHAERLPARSRRDRWGVAPDRVSVMPNPAPDAAAVGAPRRAAAPLRPRRADARVRRPAHRAEVAATSCSRRSRAARRWTLAHRRRRRGARDASSTDDLAAAGSGTASGCSARCLARSVLDLFAAADATVLSSSWENFPHSVVESLAVGHARDRDARSAASRRWSRTA